MKTLLSVCLFIPLLAQGASNYRDPSGRYTLQLPSGWNTTQLSNDAVMFTNGSAYETMLVLPGADAAATLNSMAAQTGSQWRNFTRTRRSTANFGGQPGNYVSFSGINPKGVDSYLELRSVSDGSVTYLLITSAPKADFTRVKGELDGIQQGFLVAAAPKRSATPAPAATLPPAAGPPPAAGGMGGGKVYQMKLVRVVDEHGFDRPMTALSLLIPSDWQFQGGVQYGQGAGCHANMVRLTFRAASADGKLGVEMFPGNSWQWSDDPNTVNMMRHMNQQSAQYGIHGCDIMAPMTAANFLRQYVLPAVRRGANVTGAEPMSDAAQKLQEEARQLQQFLTARGMRGLNIRTDAGRVRVSYSLSGQAVEEWFTAMTSATSIPGPNGRMGQTLYYSNAADHVFASRAPQGQLDAQEKLFQLIMATVRTDPEWQRRVQQVISNMQATDSSSAMDRSRIIAQAGQDQAKIIHDTYQNATNSREHSMANWSQYMRGVQTFRNPNTGDTVELSNDYAHAWAGPNGQYIVTDSPNFNPNSSLQGNWTPLQAVQR